MRPPDCRAHQRTVARTGLGLLLLGAGLLLSLHTLRARTDVSDVVWFLLLVGLLAAGGGMLAQGVIWTATPADRRRIARCALIVGVVALGAGGIGLLGAGGAWSEAARGSAALAFCLAFGAVPAALVLLRRSGAELRMAEGRAAAQRAAVTPPTGGES